MADKKKKKILKTYTTAAGSQQYGSVDDFEKASEKAYKKFLSDDYGKDDLELVMRLDAGDAAARSKEFKELYGQDNSSTKMYDKFEKKHLARAAKEKAERLKRKDKTTKNILKKAKGGAVRAYNNGGAVMAGRGPKYKGIR